MGALCMYDRGSTQSARRLRPQLHRAADFRIVTRVASHESRCGGEENQMAENFGDDYAESRSAHDVVGASYRNREGQIRQMTLAKE